MSKVQNVKVFVDEEGNYGDSVPVIIDIDRKLTEEQRKNIVKKQNVPEVAFINDSDLKDISIVHEKGEIGFAGTVALAASWFLSDKNGIIITSMQGRDSTIETWQDDGVVWVNADSSNFPPWNIVELDSVKAVDNIKVSGTEAVEHTMFWSWTNEAKGLIRARTFANDWGITEAEGNGSGCMKLAQELDRSIAVIHGQGSIIYAAPGENDTATLGGRAR